MEVLQIISLSLGIIMTGFSLLTVLSEGFRERMLKSKAKRELEAKQEEERKALENEREERQRNTDKCLLRDAILTNYRIHKADKEWEIDDYENFEHLYEQYKALGGNSFVDKLWRNVQTWKIIM